MESSFHFGAFRLLYAFERFGFLVAGFMQPQVFRRLAFNSRFFFFDSFSKGMYFSIVRSPSAIRNIMTEGLLTGTSDLYPTPTVTI